MPGKKGESLPPDARRARRLSRRDQAIELKKAGASYRQIGAVIGVSKAEAARLVSEALALIAEHEQHTAAELRDLWTLRLEEAHRVVYDLLGQAREPADRLAAVDRLVRLGERYAKLHGLDRPVQLEVTPVSPVSIDLTRLSDDELDAYLRLRAKIEGGDPDRDEGEWIELPGGATAELLPPPSGNGHSPNGHQPPTP